MNTGYAAPFFYNEDGEVKLIIGSETGEIQYYDNISNNLSGTFDLITGPASLFNEGKRTALARVDINNDGLKDLFIGNYRGGVSFFKGDLNSDISKIEDDLEFIVFPNPTRQLLNISFSEVDERDIKIYNTLGQLLFHKAEFSGDSFQLNVENWEDGQYIISIGDKNNRHFTSFILKWYFTQVS